MLNWNFDSFWEHYATAQEWIKLNNCKDSRPPMKEVCLQNFSTTIANDEMPSVSYDVDMDENKFDTDEEEMSSEMIAFFEKTLAHRAEREKLRNLEIEEKRKNKTWLNESDDEYVLADEGIHGVQKQTIDTPNTREQHEEYKKMMRKKYGKETEKLVAMELSMNFKFNQHYNRYKPSLWPNIPLRF